MLEKSKHRLLKRQLKKSGLDILDNPKFEAFLSMVDDAYKSFDNDVKHIEHILEESSKELFVANQKLIFERDNTRSKLEQIVDNVGGVIFETDLEGNFTFLNNAWYKYSGLTIESSIGKNYKDFLSPDNIEGIKVGKSWFLKRASVDSFKLRYSFSQQSAVSSQQSAVSSQQSAVSSQL